MATELLKGNVINRTLNETYVNLYENQMRTDRWMSTGDSIKISEKGLLLDGQHRLSALIKYGKPLEFLVVEGLAEESFKVMDTGKSRSASDVLKITGHHNTPKLAGVVKTIILFKAGHFSQNSGGGKGRQRNNTTNSDVLQFVDANPTIHECVTYANDIYRSFRFVPSNITGALYFMISKKNQEKADQFFEKFSKGIDLSETNPIRLLRDRLIRDSANKTKLTGRDKMALIVMAWNAFITGKRVQQFVLQKNYAFPKLV